MPAISGSPWRGLTKIALDGGAGNRRAYTVSVTDVVPDSATGNQATWTGTPNSSLLLRLEWDSTGIPLFNTADTATINVRLPSDATNIGDTWTPTISGASGSATRTFHFDDNPLNESAGTARAGMVEVFLQVSRGAAVAWGPVDSRGGGTPPAATTLNWANGYYRATSILSAFAVSNASLGGTEPASFAFPDTTFTRATLNAIWFRSLAITHKHRQSAADVRTQDGSATTSVTREFTWSAALNGSGNAGRINSDYAAAGVDVRFVLPSNVFGGTTSDVEYAWNATGHATGFTVNDDSTITNTSRFTADPAISFNTVASTQTVFNRGEASSHSFKIKNARTDDIGINALWDLRDSGNTVKQSFNAAPSAGTYTGAYTIGVTDKAEFNLTGDTWNIITTFPDHADITTSTGIFKVSRMWQLSTSGSSVNNRIFTGKASNPTTQNVTRNRGQSVFWDAFVYNVRSELLGSVATFFNVKTTASDAAFNETSSTSFTLASGRINGASATYVIDEDETVGGKTLVVMSANNTAANTSRTGTAGSGNFAESATGTAEWTASATYVVESRVQKESTRNADAEDTSFTIGFDTIYAYAQVLDQSGDAVNAVTVNFDQRDPSDTSRQTRIGVTNSGGDTGWTSAVGFDTRTPGGSGWVQRATIETNLGNSGTNDQSIAMVSAFTANKNIGIYVYPTAEPGRHVKPNETIGVLLTFRSSGTLTAPDTSPVPSLAIGRKNSSTHNTEFLQTDGTFTTTFTAHALTVSPANSAMYYATIGSGGTINIATTNIAAGTYNIFVVLYSDTQEFRDDQNFLVAASNSMHPFDSTAALPEANVLFSATGHAHTGGVSGAAIGDRG